MEEALVFAAYRDLLERTPYPTFTLAQRPISQDPPYSFHIKWDAQGKDALSAIAQFMQFDKPLAYVIVDSKRGNETYAPMTFSGENRHVHVEFYGETDMQHGFPGYDPYATAATTNRLADPAIKQLTLTGFTLEEMLLFFEEVDIPNVLDEHLFGK